MPSLIDSHCCPWGPATHRPLPRAMRSLGARGVESEYEDGRGDGDGCGDGAGAEYEYEYEDADEHEYECEHEHECEYEHGHEYEYGCEAEYEYEDEDEYEHEYEYQRWPSLVLGGSRGECGPREARGASSEEPSGRGRREVISLRGASPAAV